MKHRCNNFSVLRTLEIVLLCDKNEPGKKGVCLMFMLLAGGLLIILLAVVIAVVSSVVSAVAAATDDAED